MKNAKIFLNISIFVLVAQFTAIAQVKMPQNITYGTVYCIFHEEFDNDQSFFKTVDEDVRKIKESNFNVIMPFPFGQWDAKSKKQDWVRTDYLVKKIEENNLHLMPIMLKSARRAYLPEWKLLELSEESRRGVDFLQPEILKTIDDYFKSVAERYGDSPSLIGYNIWNEPHYSSNDKIIIPRYHEWLKNKYKSIENLNKSWAEDYTQWSQVNIRTGGGWWSSMPSIDGDLFRFSLNGVISEWCYNTMRKYDSVHFLTINPLLSVEDMEERGIWSIDGTQISPHTDIFGMSFYPDKNYEVGNDEPMPYWRYNCIYNSLRCDAGQRPYFLVEAQTNQQNGLGLFQFLSYDDIYLMSWMAFADNCKGIIFWKWKPFYRGQQSFGRGLLQGDGELAPRGLAAKDVGAVLNKHGDKLYKAQMKPAQTGILYDIVALQKSLVVSNDISNRLTHRFMNYSYEGTFKALFDNNLNVDIIRTDLHVTLEDLSKYKVLIMPYQLVIRKEIADLLKLYVSNGGWLIADARSAIMNEFDIGYPVNPGAGLDKVFGARRIDFYGKEGSFDIEVTDSKVFNEIKTGFTFDGIYFKDNLKVLEGAEVIARFEDDDMPALIANHYGKGVAILSAIPLGGSYYKDHRGAGKILTNMVLKSGAVPTAYINGQSECHEVMVRVHTIENELIVYICNTSANSFTGTITIPGIDKKYTTAIDMINEKEIKFSQNKNDVSFENSVVPHRTQVILMK